jgi:hypothetical protein
MYFLQRYYHFLFIVLATILLASPLITLTFNSVEAQTPTVEFTYNCVDGIATGSFLISNFPEGFVTFTHSDLQPGQINGGVLVPSSGTATFGPFENMGQFSVPRTFTAFVDDNNNRIPDSNEISASTTITIVCSQPPASPSQQIQNLMNTINNLNLDNSILTSLLAPLKQAVNILENNNPTDDVSVCNKLNAFIQKVNAQTQNNRLSQEQANQLIQAAQLIRNSLSCS